MRVRKLPVTALKKSAFVLLASSAAWVAVALMGYGLALGGMESWRNENFQSGEVRGGRIESIDYGSTISPQTKFKLEGFPLEFIIPREFEDVKMVGPSLADALKLGSNVQLKSTLRGVVLELATNSGTPFIKPLMDWSVSATRYPQFIDARLTLGKGCFWAGVTLLLLVPVMLWLGFRTH